MKRFRTPESVRRQIDLMVKRYGKDKICLDSGIGAYQFSRYKYEEPSYSNNYTSCIILYYIDFDANRTERTFTILSANDLRKPTKYDCGYFTSCLWEEEYPTLLEVREYRV